MFRPTQKTYLSLSTSAEMRSQSSLSFDSLEKEISQIETRLREKRLEYYKSGDSVFDVTVDEIEGHSLLPKPKLEEIQKLNDQQWRRDYIDAIKEDDWKDLPKQQNKGLQVSGRHFQFPLETATISEESASIPVASSRIDLELDVPIGGVTSQFDNIVIRRGRNRNERHRIRTDVQQVEVDLANRDPPKQYAYPESSAMEMSDARLIETSLSDVEENPTEMQVLESVARKHLSPQKTLRLLMYIGGYKRRVALPFRVDDSPRVTQSIANVIDGSVEHVPQKGLLVVSQDPLNVGVESTFPSKQDLLPEEEQMLLASLEYPPGAEIRLGQITNKEIELLSSLYESGTLNYNEVKDYTMSWWVPRTVTVDSVMEGVREAQIIHDIMEDVDDQFRTSFHDWLPEALYLI